MKEEQSEKSTEKSESRSNSPRVNKINRSLIETRRIAEEMKKKKIDSVKYTQVCLYWLQGIWVKGENWEYLHYYDQEKIPICKKFLSGKWLNGDKWQYNHRRTISTKRIWKYYERGFWFNGKNWPGLHKFRELCPNYQEGFWAKGPNWEKYHLKWLVSSEDDRFETLFMCLNKGKLKINTMSICHNWGERGHTSDAWSKPSIPKSQLKVILSNDDDYIK